MNRKIALILFYGFYAINMFAQIPNGAKETFHLRIAQENRFIKSKYQTVYFPENSQWSNLISNGAMVELAYKKFTLASTFLTDNNKSGGTNKIDCDFGYEYNLTKTFKVQPFAGCEFNENERGVTMGAKLNKNFDLFDYISFGLFLGCRYSKSKDITYIGSIIFSSSDYLSASIGGYFLLYDYKRPKINRNW